MKEYKDKKFLSKVAVLYYLKDLTQQEIAKKLSISRTKVSRYLERARKEKIKINVVPMMGGLGKIGTNVQTNLIANNIADRFGGVSYIINTPVIVDNEEMKKAVKKDSSLKEIWDLIEKIKVAIMGISFADKDSTLMQMGVFEQKDIERLKEMGGCRRYQSYFYG